MAKKFKSATSSAKATKDTVSLPNSWQMEGLRSRIQNQLGPTNAPVPQLKPLRSDIAAMAKRKSSESHHHLKSFNSDPTAGTTCGINQRRSKPQVRIQQKDAQPVQKKKVTVQKQQSQNPPKSKVKPQSQQKVKETANGTGKSNKKQQKSQTKTTPQKRPRRKRAKKLSQPQQQQQNRQTFESLFGEQQQQQQQRRGRQNCMGFMSYELDKKPLHYNLGSNFNNENKDFDFEGFFWKVAERRLEANRMLLMEARADLAALRSENQKLRSVLLSTKREGEKYKRQLENQVFKKFIKDDI